MTSLPSKKELMSAILLVLQEEARVFTTKEIDSRVAKLLQVPQALLEIEDENCTGTEFSYRMRWARTELKKSESIFSPRRGEWIIT